jgi:hypothetical protein
MKKKRLKTFEDFSTFSKRHHGEKFDYSCCNFTKMGAMVDLTCPTHGHFKQAACDHAAGHGCWKCHSEESKTWREEDDKFLFDNYQEMGCEYCSNKIGKTKSAIWSRVQFLKISKTRPKTLHKIIPNSFMNQMRNHAKTKNREFSVDVNFIYDLYIKQDKKCALTGWDIYFTKGVKRGNASPDRIDSNIGYIEGNIQLTHKDANLAKRIYKDEYFYQICKAVANHRKKSEDWKMKPKIEWVDDHWNDTIRPRISTDGSFEENHINNWEELF